MKFYTKKSVGAFVYFPQERSYESPKIAIPELL